MSDNNPPQGPADRWPPEDADGVGDGVNGPGVDGDAAEGSLDPRPPAVPERPQPPQAPQAPSQPTPNHPQPGTPQPGQPQAGQPNAPEPWHPERTPGQPGQVPQTPPPGQWASQQPPPQPGPQNTQPQPGQQAWNPQTGAGQPPGGQNPPGQWTNPPQPGQPAPGQPTQGQQPGQWGQQPPQGGQAPPPGQWGAQQTPGHTPGQFSGAQPPGQAPQQPQYQQPGQPQYQQQPQFQQPQYQQPGQPQQPYRVQENIPGAQGFGQPAGDLPNHEALTRGPGVSRLLLLGTLAVVFAVGGFAVWRALSGPSGGADSPEEAASMFFGSVNDEDLLGVAEIMLPSERDSVLKPNAAVLVELARLGLLSDNAVDGDGNVQDFSGLDFDIPGPDEVGALQYEVSSIGGREDLHWVVVTDGLVDVTYNPQELVDGLGGRFAEWVNDETTPQDMEIQTSTLDMREEFEFGEPVQFAVVEENGSYFVSLYYTVAGLATDQQAPNFARAPAPVGSGTPEAAVVDMMTNLVALDAEGVLTMMDPEEFRAAYDYWDTYSPDMIRALDDALFEASSEGFSWKLASAQASSENRNGRRIATIDEMVFEVSSVAEGAEAELTITVNADGLVLQGTVLGGPVDLLISSEAIKGSGTVDGDRIEVDFNLLTYEGYYSFGGERVDVTREGDCIVLRFSGDFQEFCDEQIGLQGSNSMLDFQRDYEDAFGDVGAPGFTVVERDGRWYVSGYPTFGYAMVDGLKALDKEEFDRLIESYEELLESTLGLGTF